MIGDQVLYGLGIGYVDAHLLTRAPLMGRPARQPWFHLTHHGPRSLGAGGPAETARRRSRIRRRRLLPSGALTKARWPLRKQRLESRLSSLIGLAGDVPPVFHEQVERTKPQACQGNESPRASRRVAARIAALKVVPGDKIDGSRDDCNFTQKSHLYSLLHFTISGNSGPQHQPHCIACNPPVRQLSPRATRGRPACTSAPFHAGR